MVDDDEVDSKLERELERTKYICEDTRQEILKSAPSQNSIRPKYIRYRQISTTIKHLKRS